jgi:hypothetical protein
MRRTTKNLRRKWKNEIESKNPSGRKTRGGTEMQE